MKNIGFNKVNKSTIKKVKKKETKEVKEADNKIDVLTDTKHTPPLFLEKCLLLRYEDEERTIKKATIEKFAKDKKEEEILLLMFNDYRNRIINIENVKKLITN